MRIACIHVLPVEYYPPAMTMLEVLARHADWDVSVWTTANSRGQVPWNPAGLSVERIRQASPSAFLPIRASGYLNWHLRTARAIAKWKPDVVISVEPHSALAAWTYYRVFNGRAPLFIHHHEYYAPEDFDAPGMRLLRATRGLERDNLFTRAVWISQTNERRLELLRQTNPAVSKEVSRVFPNYPPRSWVERAAQARRGTTDSRTHFLYLGSASLEDTFIGEAAAWAARHPEMCTLTIVGNNIAGSAWSYVESLKASNISIDRAGWEYDEIPERLADFDAGLVLYKGNTQNFVYNVPNKIFEYLAGGLAVWYPQEMIATAEFHRAHPALRMREMDFRQLPSAIPQVHRQPGTNAVEFTAELAMTPLIEAIAGVK